jgi:hypothetical protein
MRPLLAFILLSVAFHTAASAAEPVTSIAADGTVTGEVVVPESEALVLALLDDPANTDRLSGDIVSSSAEPDGDCTRVDRSVRGMWNPLRFVVRRCRTATGYSERLVESTDFDRHETEWEVSAVEGGTRVRYQVRSEPNLPVPRALVRSRTRSAIDDLLRKVAAAVRR